MNPAPTANTQLEAFFTRSKANEGLEVLLDLPDGTPTAHRLRIRGQDSDAFKAAQSASRRRLFELMQGKGTVNASLFDEQSERLKLVASLVISWTFPMECTEANVINLLKEAPQIAEQIDRIAANRALFYRKDSTNSLPSSPPKSS